LIKAVPFSLLVDEMINNAFRHSFNDRESGLIAISVTSDEHKTVLTVKHDGSGIDDELLASPASTGIELMKMLAQQLGGDLAIEAEDGCSYRLEIPHTDETENVTVGLAPAER
jgi:two-component sensor histidine kinase